MLWSLGVGYAWAPADYSVGVATFLSSASVMSDTGYTTSYAVGTLPSGSGAIVLIVERGATTNDVC